MVTALVLSGGTGTRFGGDIPKQYLTVNGKPVIAYCLDLFQAAADISQIVIAADTSWQNQIREYVDSHGITKFAAFSEAGKSRQHSILNGLRVIREAGGDDGDFVIIHDAVRPCLTADILSRCISLLHEYDCTMPVITVKDTVYISKDGEKISSLLDRDSLYAGQAPEGCHLGSYLSINERLSDEELSAVRGTSGLAFEKGLSVGLFAGSEKNYKITTREDFNKFVLEKRGTA